MVPRPPHPARHCPLRTAAVAAVVLVLLVWWLLPSDRRPLPGGRISIATGAPSGVYAKYGTLLKEDLAQDLPDLDVTIRYSRGSPDNIRLLTSGRADFVLAASDAVAAYRDEQQPGAGRLRACARLYDDYIHLVVRKDSPVRSVRDLKGLRIGVGADESGVQLISRRLLAAARLDFDKDVTPVRVGLDRAPAMLESGELDAFFWSGGLPTATIGSLGARTPVRLVQLGDLIGPLHAQGPQMRFYRAAVMPVDAYPELHAAGPVNTIAVANLLLTMDSTDPDLTEGITRTVIRSRDRIGLHVHAAQKVDLRTAVFTDPVQLHAGARRYYVSVKP